MGIFKFSPLSKMLGKFCEKKNENKIEPIVTPTKPVSSIENSTMFNQDTYQYENELGDLEKELCYEDEILYEEGAEYDSDDCGVDVTEDVYYDYYDSATDDDDYSTPY